MIDRFGREMFFEHSLKNKQIEILNDRVKLIPARDSDVPNMKKWEMDSIKDGYPNRTIPPEEYDRVERFIEYFDLFIFQRMFEKHFSTKTINHFITFLVI